MAAPIISISRRKITDLDRLGNSLNGNPTWKVTFDDGVQLLTAKDATVGYEVTLSMMGKTFDVEVTDGRITALKEVE